MRKPGRPTTEKIQETYAPTLDLLAQIRGISLRTLQNVRKLFAKDAPKIRPGVGWPILETKEWLDRHGVTARRKDAEMVDEREIKLAHAKLRLEREQFEFERIKSQMLPLAEYRFALQTMCTALLRTLNAFPGRLNPLLEGLDYHDRQAIIEEEIEIVKRTIYAADYLPEPDPHIE